MKILSIIVSIIMLIIAVLAATKASVYGHLFGYLRAYAIGGFAVTAFATWLIISKERKPLLYKQFHFYFQTSLASIPLALVLLPVINKFISPLLVSSRSYGSVIGVGIYILLFYIIWYLIAKRYNNNAT